MKRFQRLTVGQQLFRCFLTGAVTCAASVGLLALVLTTFWPNMGFLPAYAMSSLVAVCGYGLGCWAYFRVGSWEVRRSAAQGAQGIGKAG